MNTLKSMFGGSGAKGKHSVEMVGFPDAKDGSDEESAGLIRGADPTLGSSSGGRVADFLDKFETGPDYTVACGFLLFSILFFGMAVTSVPWILVSPKKFNLYFVFGSLFF